MKFGWAVADACGSLGRRYHRRLYEEHSRLDADVNVLRQHLANLVDVVHGGVFEIQPGGAVDTQADLDTVTNERQVPGRSTLEAIFGAVAPEDGNAGRIGGDTVAAGHDQLGLNTVAARRAAEDERLGA